MRGRGGYGAPSGGSTCPSFYEPPCQPLFEIDFTEDIQMSGPNHHHFENEHERKRSGNFSEHPAKKPRMEGPHSLLPTPSQPPMRGRPMNNHQFIHPGFCPPQEMAPHPAPRRFFRPGPRGMPRAMGPMNPRGPAPFPPPHFNRPGLPGPPPMGFRPTFPIAHRGLPPARGGPYPNRGFGKKKLAFKLQYSSSGFICFT